MAVSTAEDITDSMRNLDVSGNASRKQGEESRRPIHNYEARERSIIRHLKSLGDQSTSGMSDSQLLIRKLFLHFDEQIRNIIRKLLGTSRDRDLVWMVAEECYKQAASHSGVLHADQYFVPLEETLTGWPYDEDYEDERFYEHENRLDIDEDYARAFQAKIERRAEDSTKERQIWVDYWVDVLNHAPAGPTIFYPPANPNTQSLHFEHLPQYLFRTYDPGSSGTSNESMIASTVSMAEPQGRSRIDLLTLGKSEAAELLLMHFNKSCFDADRTDNFMSWTSSLLFAIQYAVWRSRWRPPGNIKICVVDTGKFPQGQFARDTWLFKLLEPTNKLPGPAQTYFKRRLGYERYYNGEYLSQGALSIANRSCVTSLEQLKQAGLFELYPEFADSEGSKKWTERVRELRQMWSKEQATTEREIRLAIQVARKCFSHFPPFDIASMLLTFKHRRHPSPGPMSKAYDSQQPKWADKPDEIRRYWIAEMAAKAENESLTHRTRRHLEDDEALREVFT